MTMTPTKTTAGAEVGARGTSGSVASSGDGAPRVGAGGTRGSAAPSGDSGPRVGDRAPDFTVRTTEGHLFRLSEATKTDHVVLAFFPAAFTSVCTREMCTFTERLNELQSRHAKVLGLSPDLHYSLKVWAEKNDIRVALGSDNDHEVVRAYGVAYPLYRDIYRAVPKRSVFVVDRQGTVRYRWVSEDALAEPNYDEITKVVGAL